MGRCSHPLRAHHIALRWSIATSPSLYTHLDARAMVFTTPKSPPPPSPYERVRPTSPSPTPYHAKHDYVLASHPPPSPSGSAHAHAQSVSGAPELVSSFVDKYKHLRAVAEDAQTRADKFERLYLAAKIRLDELEDLAASLPTVNRLEAELAKESELNKRLEGELATMKREQEELLAMQ